MKINNTHKVFALLGITAVTASLTLASINLTPDQKEINKELQDVQSCAKSFNSNVEDIASLRELATTQRKSFQVIKKNVGDETAIQIHNDPSSSVSDGYAARRLANYAENKILGQFNSNASLKSLSENNQLNETILNLCSKDEVRKNVKNIQDVLSQTANPKTSLSKYRLS